MRPAKRRPTPQTQPDAENPDPLAGVDERDEIDDPDDLEARADACAAAQYRNPGAWEWTGPDE